MKTCSQELLDLIPNPKAIQARATFRVTRPAFAVTSLTNNIAITDSTMIDSCSHGTGILRVANYNDYLYTQEVPDVTAATWPDWVDTGIQLLAGSRPGVDDGYVWYQKADQSICWRDFLNWTNENVGSATSPNSQPVILAPISNQRCYIHFALAGQARIWWCSGDGVTLDRRYGNVIDVNNASLDAVSFSSDLDYLYLSDRDTGRITEVVVRVQNATTLQFGAVRPIVSIDAIDDEYGLVLYGASLINGKTVVTGRLTRTSGGDPVSMDVYLLGPGDHSLGRDMFISAEEIGSKINLVGSKLVSAGAAYRGIADATWLFGVDAASLKLTTSDVGNVRLREAENRSATLEIALSSDLAHPAISKGSQVQLEIAYNDQWMEAFTGEIDAVIRKSSKDGEELAVNAVNTSAKRLAQWAPEQGMYIPSQSFSACDANDLAHIIRTDGRFEDLSSRLTAGEYNDDHTGWTYVGDWSRDPSQGTPSIHYLAITDDTGYAEFSFYGTGFKFYYTEDHNRGIHDIYIDGVLTASVNAYNPSGPAVGVYDSPALSPGMHTFRVSKGGGGGAGDWYYIDVDKIEILGTATAETFSGALKPSQLNKLSVLYTAARPSPGGLMRARFFNEGDNDVSVRNPRFGVGLNYNRESKVDAAARLGLDYSDVTEEMCGHNGVVAIYSRTEIGGTTPGVVLYIWRNSELTSLASFPVTLPLGAKVWLQIRYHDTYMHIAWKEDGETSWHELGPTWANSSSSYPWDADTGGHGCVVMERRSMITSQCYTLSSSDALVGILDNSQFPGSGEVVVDDEILSYSSKSPNTTFDTVFWMKHSEGAMEIEPGYTYGERLMFEGYGRWSQNEGDPDYLGLAVLPFKAGDNPVYSDTYKIEAYDPVPPTMWGPSTATAGWLLHVGDTNYGTWMQFNPTGTIHAIYLMPTGINRYVNEMTNFTPPEYYMRVLPALHLDTRGLHGTAISSHGAADVIYYVDIDLFVDRIEFFSMDEDIMLSDALRRVVRLAGGEFSDKAAIDQDVTVTTTDTWKLLPFQEVRSDFIAEMTLPTGITDTSVMAGMIFRASTPVDQGLSDSYFLAFSNGSLGLYQLPGITLLESVPVEFSPLPSGVVKVSVQDDRMAVWVDHKLVHVFSNTLIASGNYAAFGVYNPANTAQFTFHGRLSELNDLMADLTVGVRGKGMAVIGEMTKDRRVMFRCEPDGGLLFFKSPTDVGTLPDLVISETREELDEEISRIRVEGIQIVELADFEALARIGNIFETINSPYAENLTDLQRDGNYHMQFLAQRSNTRSWDVVFHPALQPGDSGTIVVNGQSVDVCVISSGVAFGFDGENFNVDASLKVYEL